MSTNIENRVATFSTELTFENGSFEKNVATSLGTLSKLKEALNFKGCEASFEQVAQAAENFHLDKVADGVDQLTKRFSVMGIVGMTNIMDLTRYIRSHLLGAVNTVTGKIVEGGKRRAMNVEQARFLLQGLLDDSSQIEEIMENARQSVLDTAYGYDQAAMAAAQFATSGIKAGEQMTMTLKGVAGVAATTNSAYSSISEIFSQVAGKGRLMGDELLQLSSRGLNAAAIIAKYFNEVQSGSANASDSVKNSIKELTGGLQVTEGEIREWTSKGKINFEMFASAMSETFGDHAKDANKTLTGVLSNVNARFSQIGEKFVTPLVQQEGPLVQFFNTIKDKLAEVRDNIDPLAKLFDGAVIKGLSEFETLIKNIPVKQFFDSFNQGVNTIQNALSPFDTITKDTLTGLGLTEAQLSALGKTIRAVARDHGIEIDKMIAADGKFLDTLDRGWLTFDLFKEALDRVFGKSQTDETVKNINDIREAAIAVIRGDYGNGEERIKKLTEAGFDPQVVQDYVNKIHEATGGTWQFTEAMLDAIDAETGGAESLGKLSDKQLKAKGYSDEQIKALRELAKVAEETGTPLNDLLQQASDPFANVKLLIESATNVLSNFGKVAGVVKEAFKEVFPPVTSTQIAGIVAQIHAFSKTLVLSDDTLDKIKRTFVGVFSAIRLGLGFAIGLVRTFGPIALSVFSSVIDIILSVTATIGDFVGEFAQAINETGLADTVLSTIGTVFEIIIDAGGKAIEVISGVASAISEFVSKNQLITKAVTFLSSAFEKVASGIGKLREMTSAKVSMPGVEKLVESFTKLKNVVTDKLIGPAIEKITKAFSGKKLELPKLGSFVGILEKITNFVADKLAKGIDILADKISKFDLDKFVNTFTGFVNKIKTNVAMPVFDKLVEIFGVIKSHLPSLETVVSTVQNFFGIVANNGIGGAFETITTFIKSLVDNGPSIDTVIGFVKNLFDTLTANFKMPGFENFIDIISNIDGKIGNLEKAANVTASLSDAASANFEAPGFKKLKETFDKIKQQFVDGWVEKYNNFVKSAKEYWNSPGLEKVRKAFEQIKQAVEKLDAETVYMWLSRFVKLLTLLGIRKAIDNLASAFQGVSDAWKGVGEAIKGIAGSFAKIGDSISGGIKNVMDSLSNSITMVGKAISANLKAGVLLKIALSILILAGAMLMLTKIPEDKYEQVAITLAVLALCLGVMFAIIAVFSQFGDIKGAGTAILSFSLSLIVIGIALERIAKIAQTYDLTQSVWVVVSIIAILATAMKAISGAQISPGAVAMPIAFALALGLLVLEIKGLVAAIDTFGDKIWQAAIILAGMIAILTAAARALSGAQISPVALAMPISFVLGLLLLTLTMVLIGKVPEDLMQLAMERTAMIGGALVFAMAVLGGLKINMAHVLLPISFVLALAILAFDIVALTAVSVATLGAGIVIMFICLAAVAAAAGLMLWLSHSAQISPAAALVPISLVIGVGLLAVAIAALGVAANFTDIKTAGIVIMGVLAVLTVLTAGLAKALSGTQIPITSIVAMVVITVALGTLILAIAGVSKICTLDEIRAGVLAMIVAALALGSLAAEFSTAQINPAMVVGPILFTLAMVTLMAAMVILGVAPWDIVLRGIALCGTAAFALFIVAAAFHNIKVDPSAFALLLAFVGMVALLIAAIIEIGSMEHEDAVDGIVGVIGSVLALAAAIWVLSIAAPNLDVMATSFVKFAAGCILVGVAVGIVAVAFVVMTSALAMLQAVDPATITASLGGLALVIVAVGVAALAGFVPLLGVGAAMLMVGGGALLLAAAISILVGTFPAVIEGAKQIAEGFQNLGASVVGGAVGGVVAGAKGFAAGVVGMAKSGFDGFCKFFGINSPSKLMALVSMFIPAGAGAGVTAGAAIPAQAMTDMGNGMLGSFTDTMFGPNGIGSLTANIPKEAGDGLASMSGAGMEEMNTYVQSIKDQFGSGLFDDNYFAEMSGKIPEVTGEGVEGNTEAATEAINELFGAGAEGFDMSQLEKYTEIGGLFPESMGEGVLNGSGDLTAQLQEMMQGSEADVSSFITGGTFSQDGRDLDMELVTGIDGSSDRVSNAAKRVADDARRKVESTKSEWRDVGKALGEGLGKGIEDKGSYVKRIAEKIVSDANAAAKKKAKSNSPSKVWMKLGNDLDEGLIIGMLAMRSDVERSAKSVMQGVITAAQKPIDMLSDLMSSDIVDDPVITPVLDLSDIQNGANRLYSMLDAADRVSLNGNVELANAASMSITREQRRARDNSDRTVSELVNAISGLSELIGNTGNVYNVNGITYDDGSNVSAAIEMLIRAARVGGRA